MKIAFKRVAEVIINMIQCISCNLYILMQPDWVDLSIECQAALPYPFCGIVVLNHLQYKHVFYNPLLLFIVPRHLK